MNRPKKSEYMKIGDTTTPYIFYKDRYMDALEFYIDFLEEVLEGKDEYIRMLKKALDKACEQLSMNEEAITLHNEYHDKERWREWCLKDEK